MFNLRFTVSEKYLYKILLHIPGVKTWWFNLIRLIQNCKFFVSRSYRGAKLKQKAAYFYARYFDKLKLLNSKGDLKNPR